MGILRQPLDWVTSISSTICQTSSGEQMAPTSGSCSMASLSISTSPVTAALTDMRCTLIEARQVAAQASESVRPADHVEAETVDEAGRLDDGILGQIGDEATVLDVEVASVVAAGLQRLDDVARMLVRRASDVDRACRLPRGIAESRSRTSSGFRWNSADILPSRHGSNRTCRSSDGFRRALAIPGQVFGEVAVRLGRVEAEALEDVDADFFLLRIDRMPLEGGYQLVAADRRPRKRMSIYQVW